ncbi:MAG: selenocysteine-specific translation elongation factor [Acidobacteria bacterium]|nr:selenocysteine-specific translation elongation factor [Acidobacteriota bacterium]
MPVVGTAGHVDHGKSTLVQALTGRDPDRWAEEKKRGLTIDLGFAWTTLPSGTEVGFVDVPGHERFIKNMLAGIDAITVALFVVAADEGWMPQSEEHLAILDLLGVDHGIIALTRADLVDEDTLEIVALEIDDRLASTSLQGSPIIATAAPEGRGIEELRTAIDTALAATSIADLNRPRLWVDRSFSISGAGTVVTGTLVDGAIEIDDLLTLFPAGSASRVRSIQSHERSLDRVGPGNRTALNLVGIERDAIDRGSMLGREGEWFLTRRFMGTATTVRSLGSPIRERGAFHLHLGSGSWPARIRLLEAETLKGTGGILIEVDTPLPVRWGDRFILREVGRKAVVAGGVVLDPAPPPKARHAASALSVLRAATTPDEAADAFLTGRGTSPLGDLAAQTGGGIPDAALVSRSRAFSAAQVSRLLAAMAEVVDGFHDANPLRPGIPKARLAEHIGVHADDLESLLGRATELEETGAEIRRVGFGADLGAEDQKIWETALAALRQAGFSPPRRIELALGLELEHSLVRSGSVIEVSSELIYLPDVLDAIIERAGELPEGFTVADFRDALGITRKHAIPLLEWMDTAGVTIRDGDGRRINPRKD